MRNESLRVDIPVGVSVREAWDSAGSDEWRRKLIGLLIERIDVNPSRKLPRYQVGDIYYKFSPEDVAVRWRT